MAMYRLYPMLTALDKAKIPYVVVADTHYVYDGSSWHRLPTEDYDETMEAVIEELEEQIEQIVDWRLDYEENHQDAGDSYAFLVRESYSGHVPEAFTDYMEEHHEDLEAEDIKEIYERILDFDIHEMVKGSIYGPFEKNGVVIDSYSIDEIECQSFIGEDLNPTIGEYWQQHIALAWIAEHSHAVCSRYTCRQYPKYRSNPPQWQEQGRKDRDVLSYGGSSGAWFAVIPYGTIDDQVEEHLENLES
jgi:hypothetical protein